MYRAGALLVLEILRFTCSGTTQSSLPLGTYFTVDNLIPMAIMMAVWIFGSRIFCQKILSLQGSNLLDMCKAD